MCGRASKRGTKTPINAAYVLDLGEIPYLEAWELQRSLAAAVSQGAMPDAVVLCEHPATVTLGRRAGEDELHLPPNADIEVVETDRGGKSTFHAPGQLVCYPILDLNRYGRDVRQYCRDLEEVVIRTLSAFELAGERIEGLTGVWVGTDDEDAGVGAGHDPPAQPRKIASIGVHISRWITTHGLALNVDLDPAPFTEWITACGLEHAAFTTMAQELCRPVPVDEVRPKLSAALADVFGLVLEELPAEDGTGLWPQPIHDKVSASPMHAGRSGEAVGVEQVSAHR